MNVCIFIGNLTADPELRYTPNGDPVTNFSIAVNERRGEKEETEFVDLVCWDKLATIVAEHARKGRKVGVVCEFHIERWTDNDGGKRSRPRFRARQVKFLDKPPEGRQQQPQRPTEPQISDEELDALPF